MWIDKRPKGLEKIVGKVLPDNRWFVRLCACRSSDIVDPIAVEEIQMIVAKLKKKNIGILITDHNVNETLSITDRAYLMFEGKLLKAGTAEELAEDEQVRRVYLGKHFELKRKI